MLQREQSLSKMSSLDAQIKVLELKLKCLQVVSPIDGVCNQLGSQRYPDDRPVQRGERALEVAKTDGQWDLMVKMPEKTDGACESGS